MSNMFKEWKNMTPEQKKTEKMAILAMGVIVTIIFGLLFIACCSHG